MPCDGGSLILQKLQVTKILIMFLVFKTFPICSQLFFNQLSLATKQYLAYNKQELKTPVHLILDTFF